MARGGCRELIGRKLDGEGTCPDGSQTSRGPRHGYIEGAETPRRRLRRALGEGGTPRRDRCRLDEHHRVKLEAIGFVDGHEHKWRSQSCTSGSGGIDSLNPPIDKGALKHPEQRAWRQNCDVARGDEIKLLDGGVDDRGS